MPPIGTGSVAEHLQPGLRQIIGTRLGGRESHYTRMYNVETTVRNFEDYLAATGLPIAVEKPQGQNIQSFDPVEGSTKRLTPVVYAIGFEVTEEAWDDDLYAGQGSALRDAAEGLADALAERVEIEAHLPFQSGANGGFDTNNFLVLPDSSGFFATSHAPVTGAQGISQANRPSTDVDLNITSLQAAFTTFRRYRDDQGKRVPGLLRPVAMEIPPELEFVAKEILQSTERPDTANRVKNVVMGSVTMNINPYLDDTDAWFLRAQKMHTYFLWRWRPRMDSFDDRRARVAIHVAYERFSYSPVHWLGWYGTEGG